MAFGEWMKKITNGVKEFGNKIKEAFTGRKNEGSIAPIKPKPIDFGEMGRSWLDHERHINNRIEKSVLDQILNKAKS